MSYIKKTILLSNNKKDIAVLNVFKDGNNTVGSIKHANFSGENLILGVCVDNVKILKQNIFLNDGTYNFKFENSFDINSNIGCVIIEKKENKIEPRVWGENDNIVDFKQRLLNDIEKEESVKVKGLCETHMIFSGIKNDNENIKEDIERIDFCENLNELCDIEKEIETEEKIIEENNKNETKQLFEVEDDEIEDEISKVFSESSDFFDMISDQIDNLFENNPREESLEEVIPNSKWVKVVFEENQKEYVIGLIYNLGVLKYVCYGVPGFINENPLKELEEYSQWLPLPDRDGAGYWIMFQDAQTGENIKYNNE